MTSRPPFSSLSVASSFDRHKLTNGAAWLQLLDIVYPGDGLPAQPPDPAAPPVVQQHLRFVRDLNPFTFDAGDGNGPNEYMPFSFAMGDQVTSSNASVPSCELKASNTMRALQGLLEQVGGVVGANLFLYEVSTTNPAGEPDLYRAYTVQGTTCDAKEVTFKLGASSPVRRNFPIHQYFQNYCCNDYNSPVLQAATAAAIAAGTPLLDPPGIQCGYLGPMTTCSKTIDGPNGCQAHFPPLAGLGQVLRILTFPGIGTNGGAAAGVI